VERVLFAHRVLPALRPDVAQDPGPYSEWVQRQEERRPYQFTLRPDAEPLHLVMVVADEPPPVTVSTLHALQQQTTTRWTLTVVLRDSRQTAFTALLAVSGLQRTSQRVRVECVDDASTPDQMLRLGVAVNQGAQLALLFPGDVWAPDAVAQLISSLSARTVVYADEDSVAPEGDHVDPRLKPAFSPEFLLSSSYIGRPLAIGAGITVELSASTVSLADLEHDLALQACEAADEVVHLPHVLCHRLIETAESAESAESADPGAHDVAHVAAALQRRGQPAEVTPGQTTGTYRIRRHSGEESSTTIIIPFRDQPQFMRTCIESIDATRGARQVDFVLVDNGSAQPETLTLVERLGQRRDVQVLEDARPFNWSELSNAGATLSAGDILLFLNNDIEAHKAGWIDALAGQAMRPDVGAVGARLLYPDRRLQHAGVVVGVGGAADHVLAGLEADQPGYLNMAVSARECAAVTGACLATRRDVFESLGGFDEALGVDLNDIDYCLRAQREGLKVLYEATAELIHHESPSRGFAGGARDIQKFIERWKSTILAGDPYLNPNLTRVDSSCALRRPDEGEWWKNWYASFSEM
jgi:GT2 family glycosyltransferase